MNVATQNLRSPVSQVPGVGSKDELYLWGMRRFGDGSPPKQYPVFLVVQGDRNVNGFDDPPVPGLLLTQREMSLVSKPGQVPLDQRWSCLDVGVELVAFINGGSIVEGVPAAVVAQVCSLLGVFVQRGQTQFIDLGPASLYPGGVGIYGGDPAANAAGLGFPSIAARRRLDRALVLNPGDTWFGGLTIANADGLGLVLGEGNLLDVRLSFWMHRDLGLSG
jgi:hypothetical protein